MTSAQASSIQPRRAPVRPRVFVREIRDAMPLVDVLLEELERSVRMIEIVGGPGMGKTTALADLAASVPPNFDVVYLDDASLAAIAEAARIAVVVFTSLEPRSLPDSVSYRLAPWISDDLINYLLAVHPEHCRSVMSRLQAATDRRLPRGVPELWRCVLDRMADDDAIDTVSGALRADCEQNVSTAERRAAAEQYCLAALTERFDEAADCQDRLRPQVAINVLNLLRHDAVRILLAADRLARLVKDDEGHAWLERRMPRELIEAAGKELSPAAIAALSAQVSHGPESRHTMAASLLHAAGTGWRPLQFPLPSLEWAYLGRAAWPGINLFGAQLTGCDFSDADLTGAVLNEAIAHRATFSNAVLVRASLVRFQGREVDCQGSVMTFVNAAFAVFRQGVLSDCDLSESNFKRADLYGAKLTNSKLMRCDLSYATLTDAVIDGTDFSSADLSWTLANKLPLRKACLTGAIFAHAQLRECDLEDVELAAADFREADLEGAYLTGSRMQFADFAGACLRGAGLADIDWEGADLRHADLRHCTFHLGSSRSGLVGSPLASEGTRTGFYSDDFDSQTYRPPEEIRKANLCGADLRDANLEGTDFYLVDLRGANYTPAQAEHFRRCGAILFDRE